MSNQGNSGQRGGGLRGNGRGFGGRGGGGPSGRGGGRPRGRGGGRFQGGGGRGGDIGRGRGVIFAEGTPANIPSRLSEPSHTDLIKSFESLAVNPERPVRPGFGTVGTPISLRANFFAVVLPKGPFYDYVVEISPKPDINRLEKRIFKLLELSPMCAPHLPYIAHDHSQRLVSARELPQPLDISVAFYDDHESGPRQGATVYTVSIKFERQLDLHSMTKYLHGGAGAQGYDPLPLVSALNLVLQQHASRTGVRVGKNRYFFSSSAQRFKLGTRVEAWQGFFASVRPTYDQLMVNVNVCMTAFIEPGNLADALIEFKVNSRGAMPSLPSSMKKIKIRTLHSGHKKAIFKVGTRSARDTEFSCEELGRRVTVEQYFLEKYNKELEYPTELPVINIGSAKKAIWVPAEMCEIIAGQPLPGKLSDEETAQMIRYACNPPKVNAETIVNQGFPTLGLNPTVSPIGGFDISIDPNMAVIPARELSPPGLSYREGRANVRNGSWNILDVKFHRGAVVTNWWLLVVRDGFRKIQGSQDSVEVLVKLFSAKCQSSGIAMPDEQPCLLNVELPPTHTDPTRADAVDSIRSTLKNELREKDGQKPDFVLVLLEYRDNFIYPGLKRIGDVELGIPTVCMQLHKALNEKRQDQYFSNVALKVNAKLGGINHLLEEQAMKWLTKKKTMMVGIDVTHPGPGSREGTPSIAAVVASVDDSFVQFPASMRIQRSKKEMLDELRDMLVERLLLYEKKNQVLPERIFVYRDGVSEGQFDQVVQEELAQILEAFKKFGTKEREVYRPQLSIIICGKRHHARFFPVNSAQADKNGNTRPGTVVDKGVTAVFDFDFYLQAHAGLQGHVKSTHYTVVYDENQLTADELQQSTHNASHLYARATKAVSLIPAAYYADLACERGRCYLNDFLVDDKTSSGGRSGKADRDEENARVFDAAKNAWGEGLHPDMRETMFYI